MRNGASLQPRVLGFSLLRGTRTSGLLFATSKGTAYNPSNLRNRLLYPILEEAGIDQAGFHAFRRYRVTWLRKRRVQEDLIQYWTGHGDKTVTDGYSPVGKR